MEVASQTGIERIVMTDFKVIRSYSKKDHIKTGKLSYEFAIYDFEVQSVVKDGEEARRLHIRVKDRDYYFTADNFIHRYNQSGFKSHIDLPVIVLDYVETDLNDRTAEFPVSIIFQIVLFIVMELYRYWRDKKKYEETEDKYDDKISTYNDNEYLEVDQAGWLRI